MPESLVGALLRYQRTVDGPSLADFPEAEQARRLFLEKIQESVGRIVPTRLIELEKQHGWSKSLNRDLDTYERLGVFDDASDEENALMSRKELRKNVPGIGVFMDALKHRPELLVKVEQGFTELGLVPIGLSPTALSVPMGKAIQQYRNQGTLRSSDGTKLRLDTSTPVWMRDSYKDADSNGSLVYFPQRFDPKNHGGRTKKQILESSPQPFAGWQVWLTEKLQRIPRQGKGQIIGGRPQIEANYSPHDYLGMHGSDQNSLEHGYTPEVWQSHFIRRITETQGEVLDDYQDPDGAACFCTGGYFPSSGDVPRAYWVRVYAQALVAGGGPGFRNAGVGARAGVSVL